MNNKVRNLFLLCLLLVVVVSFCVADPNVMDICKEDSNSPIIIWYYAGEKSPAVLKIALKSGLFTHVMLAGMHRYDVPDYTVDPNFRENVLICKNAGVKIIWKRWLWPGYKFKDFKYETIFDSQYYIDEINFIKQEAKRIGADYTAFDCEVYGKNILMSIPWKRSLTEDEDKKISEAVTLAIKSAGNVNFLLPAAMPYPRHTHFKRDFSHPFQNLGVLSIAEHTYFNNQSRIYCENNRYDIFGAWCEVETDKSIPAPKFTPEDILMHKEYWSFPKKGLFIYPGEGEDIKKVAKDFLKISKKNN